MQGDNTSATFADLIADPVQSAVDFFNDFVHDLVLFQMEPNQNSFAASKMFPLLVLVCGRMYIIHGKDSFSDCWLHAYILP